MRTAYQAELKSVSKSDKNGMKKYAAQNMLSHISADHIEDQEAPSQDGREAE